MGCHSPFRLSGADVDMGARRPQVLGKDVHPQLQLSLEPGPVIELQVVRLSAS